MIADKVCVILKLVVVAACTFEDQPLVESHCDCCDLAIAMGTTQ